MLLAVVVHPSSVTNLFLRKASMPTVSSLPSRFNSSSPSLPLSAAHLDECTAFLASPDDFDSNHAEYVAECVTRDADEAAAAEIVDGTAYAKELTGLASVDLVRIVGVNSATGQPVADYVATISGPAMMRVHAGSTPRQAVDRCVEQVDIKGGITSRFGGYLVDNVALVAAFPFRSKVDALALARRIALDPTYLDAAMEFQMPGVSDERPAPLAIAA